MCQEFKLFLQRNCIMFPPQSTVEIASPFDFLGVLTLLVVVLHRELWRASVLTLSPHHLVLTERVPQFSLSLMNGGTQLFCHVHRFSVLSMKGDCSLPDQGCQCRSLQHPRRTSCPVALPRKGFRCGGEQMFTLPLRGAPLMEEG